MKIQSLRGILKNISLLLDGLKGIVISFYDEREGRGRNKICSVWIHSEYIAGNIVMGVYL